MKKIIISCALLSTMQFVNAQTAQTEEKIILQDSKPSTEVHIEIKEGNVYIDGKKVAPYSVNKNLKIIKKLSKSLNGSNIPDIDISIDKDVFGGDIATSNKPMLGVSTEPSKTNNGAVVNTVNANTPAAKIGLQEGDVITKINKTAITTPQDLVTAIGNYKPGDEVTISYTRDNKEMTKQATLAARDNDKMGQLFGGPDGGEDMMGNLQQMMKRFGDFGEGSNPFEGMEEIGADGNVKIFGKGINNTKAGNNSIGLQVQERADNIGVLVTNVKENSAAAKAGIKVDDVLTAINGKNVSSIDDITNAIGKMGNTELETEIMRSGKKQIIKLKLEKQLRKKEF